MRIGEIGSILGSIFGISHAQPNAAVSIAPGRGRVAETSAANIRIDFEGDGKNEVTVENSDRTSVTKSGKGSTRVLAARHDSGSAVGLDTNGDGRPDFRVSVGTGVGVYGNVREAVDESAYRIVVPGGIVVGRDQTSLALERNSRGEVKVKAEDRQEVQADIAGKGRVAYAKVDTTVLTREAGEKGKAASSSLTQSSTTSVAIDRNRDGKNEGAAVFASSISISAKSGAKVSVTTSTSQSAQIGGTKISGGGSSASTLLPV